MLTITPIYGGLIALLFLWLSAAVIRQRFAQHVSVGDGDNEHMRKAIRVQANCAEYAPIGLLLMVMAELQGAPVWAMHILGAMLLGGRVLHAVGFGRTPQISIFRSLGIVLTFGMILIAAIANIGHALF